MAALRRRGQRGARSSESDESEEMTLAIRAHPMYSRLVEAYYECRKIGADSRRRTRSSERRARCCTRRRRRTKTRRAPSTFGSTDALDLDDYMRECTHELESYVKELHTAYESAKECCEHFEAERETTRKSCAQQRRRRRVRERAPATADEHADASDDFDKISPTHASAAITKSDCARISSANTRRIFSR